MSELQQNRYDQLLRRLGDLKGPGSMVNDVLSELFPMLDVESNRGELQLLSGTYACFGGVAVTGAVGEVARTQLFNPLGSGKIITVTSVVVAATTSTMRWTVTGNALTTGVGTERFADSRAGLTSRPTGQVRSDSTVALTDASGQTRVLNNDPFVLTSENGLGMLGPGSGFEIGTATTATTIYITFYWRERVAEPSELSF